MLRDCGSTITNVASLRLLVPVIAQRCHRPGSSTSITALMCSRHFQSRTTPWTASIASEKSFRCSSFLCRVLIRFSFESVYDQFVEGMDGSDNGIENSRGLYKERTDIGARVARLNKPWNFTGAYDSDAAFASAVDLCGSELSYFVKEAVEQWLPGRKIVEQGLAARLCEEVVVLSEFCPWADHLVELQGGGESKVFFVLYPDGKEYRIRAVPKAPDSFELLNPLREEWRGLRGEQLDAVSGVPGGVFVHANGFVGGHKTLEGAIEMAMRSLKLK